jgi:hypothetical protein
MQKESDMKRNAVEFSTLLGMVLMLGFSCVRAQESGTKAAQTSTQAWLSLVDKQDYASSWETAAGLFKNAITREKWQDSVKAARAPFGSMKARTLKSATATSTLPGAPDGEYVVFQFDTSFEQKSAAVETVTAIREKDGTWHVGGYYIK